MFDKNILFDLDGTLTDPGIGITNSVMYALKKFGIEPPPREELFPFIGPPLSDSFMRYYGMDEEKATLAISYYREYFSDIGIFENEVYKGIPETLAALKEAGFHLAVATSKPEQFAKRIVDHFDLKQYFEFTAGSLMNETRVMKHEVIAYALETGGFLPEETIMIGDRKHDVEGARKNNLPCIGVLFGYGSREELLNAGAVSLAASPEELLTILKK